MGIELTKYKISQHCEQRYAERLLGKDSKIDINKFIIDNKEKIKTDLNKMITYGELIYQGKQSQKDGKGKVLDVFLKDTWIILVDSSVQTIVTIYKIDLGCGDEFNLQYISKMIDNLNQKKEKRMSVKLEVETESNTYREMIEEANLQIKEYKSYIKNLESLCEGYKAIIDNDLVKVSQADRDVADVINTLVNKKEF